MNGLCEHIKHSSLPSREQNPARMGRSTGALDQEDGVWKWLKYEILSGEQVG